MAPVAISGESGTGKEVAARAIHAQGPRASGPFIAVNCGAIPEALMEAEFFGYRKGAFTGAVEDRNGFFQAAQGGTLLLDEVADLPLSMQVKLLRVIQERKVRKVGATTEEPIDVRLISATHKDLARMVVEGVFRQDLYYRLNVIELHLPALDERPEDIPELAQHLLERICERHGQHITMTKSALDALGHLSFRGNVRELENTLERAVALASGLSLTAEDIALATGNANSMPLAAASESVEMNLTELTPENKTLPGGNLPSFSLPGDLVSYMDNVERSLIEQALIATRYNRTQAAVLLGLSFRQFRYRMQRLGIK
jgi:two-component system response regulator PilR (NtrC family)